MVTVASAADALKDMEIKIKSVRRNPGMNLSVLPVIVLELFANMMRIYAPSFRAQN